MMTAFHSPMCPPQMSDTTDARSAIEDQLSALEREAVQNTRRSLKHMEQYGIRPEGKVQLFLPPDTRAADELDRLPYPHETRQVVTYQTEPGEFSALCPFSGLPDYATLYVEYVPGDWLVELKSLKYYIVSWRNIGAAQEELTPLIFQDLHHVLGNPEYLRVKTEYNVRGGINSTAVVDSREQ